MYLEYSERIRNHCLLLHGLQRQAVSLGERTSGVDPIFPSYAGLMNDLRCGIMIIRMHATHPETVPKSRPPLMWQPGLLIPD